MPAKNIRRFWSALAVTVLLTHSARDCRAQDASVRDRDWYFSIYGYEWAEAKLFQVPARAFTGSLPFLDAYLLSLGAGYALLPNFAIPLPGTDASLRGNSIEVEAQIGKHFGLDDTYETDFALLYRTPQIPLFGGLSINLAAGEGVSYTFTNPQFEFGGTGVRGVDTYRFQNYLAIEAEITHVVATWAHLVARVHHRSGIYGVISPTGTGSNYVGGGLRFDLSPSKPF